MQISVASILATATIAAGIVSAAAPKGLVFNRFLQVWFENGVIHAITFNDRLTSKIVY
jgi:hypothetical protein